MTIFKKRFDLDKKQFSFLHLFSTLKKGFYIFDCNLLTTWTVNSGGEFPFFMKITHAYQFSQKINYRLCNTRKIFSHYCKQNGPLKFFQANPSKKNKPALLNKLVCLTILDGKTHQAARVSICKKYPTKIFLRGLDK